jgi:threonine/homoserine/homoserine lactone efflux protein
MVYTGLKIAGGLYLVYIASKIWRGARAPLTMDTIQPADRRNVRKSFWTGLSTQLSNPKTAIAYGSIFAALLPQHPPLWSYFALPPLVSAVEAGWYTVVAMCFSSRRPREMYAKAKAWIDRIAAGVIGALGLRLILTAHKTGI